MNFNLNAAKALLGAAVVAGAVTAISQPASAITVNTGGTTVTNEGQVSNLTGDPTLTTLNFNNDTLGARAGGGSIVSGNFTIANGDLADRYAAPPGDTSKYLTIGSFTQPDFATFDLGGDKGYFGLFVGSLDTFNSIEFFRNGVSKLVLDGVEIAKRTGVSANGDKKVGVYYNFFGENNSDVFDKVKLGSTGIAFEVDNIAYRKAIPTPALLPGLIGMGVAAWRKRKGEAAQSEA